MRIAFVGQMNCLPMQYARLFRAAGHSVTYVVDVPQGEVLSRPEAHYPDISYPYPHWIREAIVWRPEIQSLCRAANARRALDATKNAQVVFLSGHYTYLARFLPSSVVKIGVFAGSDLAVWCDQDKTDVLSELGPLMWLKPLKRLVVARILRNNFESLAHLDAVTYFPPGLTKDGDKVLERAQRAAPHLQLVRRFDQSFEPLAGVSRSPREQQGGLNVLCATRFIYRTFPEGNREVSKGNDLIIEALARYVRRNKHVTVHFVRKGVDVQHAVNLSERTGLAPHIKWHAEMPFRELKHLYLESDICFDQVGRNWLGAVGGYALYLGRPLIANYRPEIFDSFWGESAPICQSRTSEDVYRHLVALEDPVLRRELSERGKRFAEQHLTPSDVFEKFLRIIAAKS